MFRESATLETIMLSATTQAGPARRMPKLALLATVALVARSLHGASFGVPDDRVMVEQTSTIVIGSAQTSRVEKHNELGIVTITTFYVREVLKGSAPDVIELIEPGGTLDGETRIFPGSPQFTDGEECLLFLAQSDRGWHVRDIALGKFSYRTDVSGRRLLVRDEAEITGWDAKGQRHQEKRRTAEEFTKFVRTVVTGGPARADYIAPSEPLLEESFVRDRSRGLLPVAQSHGFTPTSYSAGPSEVLPGGRWQTFPPVVFFKVGSVAGAPNGGVDAINAALGAWNNESNSNVNYAYGGPDDGTHNGGTLGDPDGANTSAFEVDFTGVGVQPIQCSAFAWSGFLGNGGITAVNGTHTGPNLETFQTAIEADVDMNQGAANCSLLINNGDFNSAVTHEVGHTLGFRHADQNRTGGACAPPLECSTTAIMKAFIPNNLNATLQTWDQNAVNHVYPGSATPPPAAPTGVVATASTSTQVQVTWTAVAGATSYQIDRRTAGGGFAMVGTSMTNNFTDNTASALTSYLYQVRAVNAGGPSLNSNSDLATTVIFTNDPLTAGITVQAAHLAQLRTAVNAVRVLAGFAMFGFTDPSNPGVAVRALHVNELRTRLDEALGPLGRGIGGYTDTITAGVTTIRALHFQEIRNRVK